MVIGMSPILKAKAPFTCNTCCAKSTRVKCFKVSATNMADAKAEVSDKVATWAASLVGKNCRVCQSIIDSFK